MSEQERRRVLFLCTHNSTRGRDRWAGWADARGLRATDARAQQHQS
jgi:hypothetical protein